MNLPATIQMLMTRFEALSTRERALSVAGVLALLWVIWSMVWLDPAAAARKALIAERNSLQEVIAGMQQGTTGDPRVQALTRRTVLRAELADLDRRLAASSGGLIPPQRMIEVIRDVLDRQGRLRLVHLHNKPVESLLAAARSSPVPAATEAGPFVHPVELVIDGAYLDVLAYLKALEALPWHLQWQQLDLQVLAYPVNRVRIELGTLGMERDWIGLHGAKS